MAAEKIQKSRANQAVTDETVATYGATMGFLVAEWLGALLMVGSFTQLYAYGLRPNANVEASTAFGVGLLALGAWMYWANRRNYERMEFPWRPRWHAGALIFAAAGAVFWLLAALVWVLLQFGVNILPS